MRKAAASALAGPESDDERRRLWDTLHRESDMGVRGQLAFVLLAGARADPLDDWIPLRPTRTGRRGGVRPRCCGIIIRLHHDSIMRSSRRRSRRKPSRSSIGIERESSPDECVPMRCSYQLPVGLISSLMDDSAMATGTPNEEKFGENVRAMCGK